MPADVPSTPDSSFSSKRPAEQALSERTLDEIQSQLRVLATRMERAEDRLGIKNQPILAHSNAQESVDLAAKAALASSSITVPLLNPPVAFIPPASSPDPLPQAETSAPSTAMPSVSAHLPMSKPAPGSALPVEAQRLPLSTAEPVLVNATAENPLTSVGSLASSVEAVRARITDSAKEKRLLGDWENLIGGKWALWVGLFSLFLAISSFFAYTWKSLPPAPPSVRLALGMAAGATLIGAGSFFRTRTQRWFSEGLAGAGLAVLYLSTWAGAHQYHLLTFNTAFTLMGLTTVLGVYLAVRFDALSLSVLATLGGFMTPLLLHGQGAPSRELLSSQLLQNHSISLLTYVAVLTAGILAVSLFKRWNTLTWLSFIATIFVIGAWVLDEYTLVQRWPTFIYCTIYFLLFVGTSCFYSLARREQTAQPDLLLLFAATSVYALAGYRVLDGALGATPGIFACALALFFGLLCGAIKLLAPHNSALRQSVGGLALLFLTVAVPIQFQQQGLAIGWCVEAGVLLILGLRLRASLLQRTGQVVWCLSLVPLLGILLDVAPEPATLFLNERALPLLLSLLATALVVVQHWATQRISTQESNDLQQESDDKPVLFDTLVPLYASYVVLGGAWLLAQETYLCLAGINGRLPLPGKPGHFIPSAVWEPCMRQWPLPSA